MKLRPNSIVKTTPLSARRFLGMAGGAAAAVVLVTTVAATTLAGAPAEAAAARGSAVTATAGLSTETAVGPTSPSSILARQPATAHWLHGTAPHIPGTTETTLESTNWSGMIGVADGGAFTGVAGHWTVPSVVPAAALEASGTWIGIDGVTNNSLIQTGTAQATQGGVTAYDAWFELLPDASVTIPDRVEPGDAMQAAITEDSANMWTITLADVTQSWNFSQVVSYSTPGATVEWIEEAPTINGSQSLLADYGSMSFTNMAVFGTSALLDPVAMVDSLSGAIISTPGTYSSGSFPITYSAPPHGYWLVGGDGGIFTFGAAQFYGSTGSLVLQRPVVGITPTQDRGGYWLVASDGGIFAFGDSGYYGSIPGLGIGPAGSGAANRLNAPIVGMVPSSDGGGYFMVASDGGVFAFGDARFAGSCPGIGGCVGSAVAVMPDASGNGYWLVTTSGHVYAFGDAFNYGAPGPQGVPVTSAVRTPDGLGYWILFANGAVVAYGDAVNFGGPLGAVGGVDSATAIFTTADGNGYWVTAANGAVYSYGDAVNEGSMAGQHLNAPIIAATGR